MKRTLIIFLIIIFNINISYAKNDSNITIEEVNNFLKHFRCIGGGYECVDSNAFDYKRSYLDESRGFVDLSITETEYEKKKD